jgi:hypothetical protein
MLITKIGTPRKSWDIFKARKLRKVFAELPNTLKYLAFLRNKYKYAWSRSVFILIIGIS